MCLPCVLIRTTQVSLVQTQIASVYQLKGKEYQRDIETYKSNKIVKTMAQKERDQKPNIRTHNTTQKT